VLSPAAAQAWRCARTPLARGYDHRDLPLFVGTTLSIASFYLASQREILRAGARPGDSQAIAWSVVRRLPWDVDRDRLCVNHTRAVPQRGSTLSRFVRTPKHGIRGRAIPGRA